MDNKNNIELVYASEEQKRIGWILDMRYLSNLQSSISSFSDIGLEDIEAVLLVANGQGHLLPIED